MQPLSGFQFSIYCMIYPEVSRFLPLLSGSDVLKPAAAPCLCGFLSLQSPVYRVSRAVPTVCSSHRPKGAEFLWNESLADN